ncbi:DUF418 domain-containing protein [Nonomuraea sp. NPDC049480]|uniref:DUF418 domain-containing protein n=1 Tax=Nonomuraea sp. NPDC049480 TaxID=3364353 RepID=UPI0037873E71
MPSRIGDPHSAGSVLIANVVPIANVGEATVAAGPADVEGDWLGLVVHQRFFPIFSLLFGVGFSLLVESAGRRVPRPRLLLLRRLLVLLAIGLAHMFLLWRGDILTVYALVGLVVLLPSTWLPRWAVAGLSAALIATSVILAAGHYSLVPGLFLLGSALTRYGVTDRMERATWGPAVLCAAFAVAAAPFLWAQGGAPNYLTATVLVLAVARLVGGPSNGWSTSTVLLISGAVLAVQWVWSTLWLRRYRQGPLEWLWRWATWARRPPLRTTA